MFRSLVPTLVLLSAFPPEASLEAHPLVQGVGTQSIFTFRSSEIAIEFNVGFSPMNGFLNMIKADTNRDNRVSRKEAEAFADAVLKQVLPTLKLELDGEQLQLRSEGRRIEGLIGEIGQLQFDIFYDLRAQIPVPIDRDVRQIVYEDGSFRNELSSQICWFPLEKGSEVAFLVVEPESELVVDAIRVKGRKVRVLLSTDRAQLELQGAKEGSAAAQRPTKGGGGPTAFSVLTEGEIPACEVTLGSKEVLLEVIAVSAPPVDTWDKEAFLCGEPIELQYLGPREARVFFLSKPLPLFAFRLEVLEGIKPPVHLELNWRSPAIKAWCLRSTGHDPSIRWTIVEGRVEKRGGVFVVPGTRLVLSWQPLSFVRRVGEEPQGRWKKKARALPPKAAESRDILLNKLLEFKKNLEEGNVGIFGFLALCLFALVYGAAHAFGPGHGKSLVAAYLAGRSGRVRDAVLLGLVVTFTHLFSVYLLALGGLYLVSSEQAYRQQVVVGMQLLSSLLLFGLGATLTSRVLRGKVPGAHHHHHHLPAELDHAHDHNHSHNHGHSHSHGASGQPHTGENLPRVRLGQLLLVGLTGGMVPCPAGLVIVFASWYLGIFWAALVLLFFLSLGLGGSLIALGVSVVLAQKAFASMPERSKRRAVAGLVRKVLPVLPALSGVVIMTLGVVLFVLTISKQGPVVAGLLRAAADALDPQGG